jgi:hypothetical protein
VSRCPRCGEGVAVGQEYCLECGLRLPGVMRLAPVAPSPRRLALPLLLAGFIAVGGAAAAIALTRDSATATPILTATGGSEVVPTPTVSAATLTEWPAGKSGWTNILVSIPKVTGRDAAVARAEQARRRGLRTVGVLDSSRYPSLHSGYWVVFSGVYPNEPEATSRLREAKGVQRGARTARVSP